MPLPDSIERVALLGWRIYPASSRSKAALVSRKKDPTGAGRYPWEQATADLDQLERWAHAFPGCNWRVVMGGSGIWALDVDRAGEDHEGDGFASMVKLTKKHGDLPPQPRTRSGGGGLALFFKDTGHPIIVKTGHPGPGIDPRSTRTTVTLPPSIHLRSRQPYRWIIPPWELDPPEAPGWLLEAVRPPPEPPAPVYRAEAASEAAANALQRHTAKVMDAPSGAGNRALWSAAHVLGGWVGAGQLGAGEVAAELYRAAKARNADTPHDEIKDTIRSGLASGRRRPMEIRP